MMGPGTVRYTPFHHAGHSGAVSQQRWLWTNHLRPKLPSAPVCLLRHWAAYWYINCPSIQKEQHIFSRNFLVSFWLQLKVHNYILEIDVTSFTCFLNSLGTQSVIISPSYWSHRPAFSQKSLLFPIFKCWQLCHWLPCSCLTEKLS